MTHPDSVIEKVKGKCQIPLWARMATLKGILLLYHINGEVILSVDDDGTVTRTLLRVRPKIFAKGGDRTGSNMPLGEIEACKSVMCEIIYGVGALLNSSSSINDRIY